jgi:hypothetical protein
MIATTAKIAKIESETEPFWRKTFRERARNQNFSELKSA